MRSLTFILVLVSVSSALVMSTVGRAGAAPAAVMQPEAREHFERGLRYYNVQSYEAAIAEFKAGYQIDPRGELLYALGQAHRMNKDCAAAIAAYEAFLRTAPPPRQEAPARAQIAHCRDELAAAEPAEVSVEPQSTEPVPSPAALPPPPPVAPPPPPAPAVATAPALVAVATPPSDARPDLGVRASPPPQAPHESPPLLRRWWFWAAVAGAVGVGLGVAAAAGAFTRTNDARCPTGRECLQP